MGVICVHELIRTGAGPGIMAVSVCKQNNSGVVHDPENLAAKEYHNLTCY